MLKNKVVVTSSTPERIHHPSSLILRTRLVKTPIKKKKEMKVVEPQTRYTIDECLHRLDMLICSNIPLPKSYAHQIKNHLLLQNLNNYEEEYCNKRQKTQEALSPQKQNEYIKSIVATDACCSPWSKSEVPPLKTLKKRSIASRKISIHEGQANQIILNLQAELQKVKQELAQKETSLSDLKIQHNALILKEENIQDQITKSLIEKIDLEEQFKNDLHRKEQELMRVKKEGELLIQQLRERETEIFYFWQAHLSQHFL